MTGESFPRFWARTRRWTLGEPRTIHVISRPDGGAQVFFLRSLAGDDPRTAMYVIDVDHSGTVGEERLLVDPAAGDGELSVSERARRERVREMAQGVVSYSVDATGRWALAQLGGRVVLADAWSATVTELPLPDGAFDPRLDPSGRRIAFCLAREVHVLELATGQIRVVASDPVDTVSWGLAEHIAAEEMDRFCGYWWSPDGEEMLVARVDDAPVATWWISNPIDPASPPQPLRYPVAGTPNADVSLWRVDLRAPSAPPVQILWNANEFEYLARVIWPSGHDIVIGVQSRDQRRVQWLQAAADGSASVMAEDSGGPWVELFAGSPAWLDGELVRIADVDGHRRLLIGDRAVSPTGLHLRSIAAVVSGGVVVTAWADDASSIGVWQIASDGTTTVIKDTSGLHVAAAANEVIVLSSMSLDHDGVVTEIVVGGESRGVIERRGLSSPFVPSVDIFSTASGVRVGLVLPQQIPDEPLPVLMLPYGGPHNQQVLSGRRLWLEQQWWADQGFAVVVADGRGTPGVSVEWEHAVHGDQLTPVIEDQVEALTAASERAAATGVRLDLERVAIRGWSFGGSLAAAAVIRRPDVFHAAVSGAPNADPALYDTHYTERYLGADTSADSYRLTSVLTGAETLRRPLLIVHGFADDNVVIAHSLLLSRVLTESGRPHEFLPLSGVTHLASQESVAENLLLLQLNFIQRSLGLS